MDHVVEVGDLAIGVGDEREVQFRALRLLDVVGPALVVAELVDREAEDLDVALVELRLQFRDLAELGRAHRGEVLRVREQHAPRVAEVVVEVDRALGGLGREVRGNVAQAQRHAIPLSSVKKPVARSGFATDPCSVLFRVL